MLFRSATGVFDVLHDEHRNFLQAAKKAGDLLIVGLEPDARVKLLKGEGRPVNGIENRLKNLDDWQIADALFVLPEDFGRKEHQESLIARLKPAILAVSSHTLHQDRKAAVMEKYGGELRVVHRHNPAVSSTKIIES